MSPAFSSRWALILGGSSGIGLATAKRLSSDGYSICIIHRDRRGSMSEIEVAFSDIRKHAPRFMSLNTDALSETTMREALELIGHEIGQARIEVFLHSIAYGNLKPLVSRSADEATLDEEDVARTVHAMGSSFLSWTKALHDRKLFSTDARVFGLTSEGNSVHWGGYSAVAAAKAVLESFSKAIAVEFAPYGIRCNILQPGVIDTKALRLIPNWEKMRDSALKRNPFARLTTPEDVANVISLLSRPEASWINGALIRVDGGEHLVAG